MLKDKQLFYVISFVVALLLYVTTALSFYEFASITVTLFIFIKFVYDLGKDLSLKNVIIFIKILQKIK